MKRFGICALLILGAAALAAQTTHIVGTIIVGADNTALQRGQITMEPTDLNGSPLDVNLGSTGGLMVPRPAVCLISAGAITTALNGTACTVIDTTVTSPQDFCYRTTIRDMVSGWTAPVMPCVQPSGATWSFNTYVPSAGSTALQVVGPPGPGDSLSIGTVSTLSPGTTATASVTGSSPSQTLNLGIPRGATGAVGPQGPTLNPRGAYSSSVTYATGDLVSYNGSDYACISGCTGVTPVAGSNWLLAAPQTGMTQSQMLSLVDSLPISPNLFNVAMAQSAHYIAPGSGSLVPIPGSTLTASGFIPVIGGEPMISSEVISNAGSPNGLAFYDSTQTYVSGIEGVAAATAFSVPSSAAWVRITLPDPAAADSEMLVEGTALPSSYVPFLPGSAQTVANEVQIQSQIDAALSDARNLIDPAAITWDGCINSTDGTVDTFPGVGCGYTPYINVIPGATYVIGETDGVSPPWGAAFYDAQENFVGAYSSGGFTAGQTFTVPAGAVLFRMSVSGGNPMHQMLMRGMIAPTNYVPFGVAEATVSPANAKTIGLWGDSISNTGWGNGWWNVVTARTGANLGFVDAVPGRGFYDAFSNYSGGACNGTNTKTGVAPNTGTLGNTVAQDIANLDGMIVFLGTGDVAQSIGAPGDATTAGTTYGNVRETIECLLTAKPTLRIMMVTPYNFQSATPAVIVPIVTAIQTVAANYGIPVLDMYTNSGINSFNASTTLQSGVLHPTAWSAQNLVGPAVAEFVKQWF